jgi:1-acyl-sn-glycerol-3-phosphate acyltransferase
MFKNLLLNIYKIWVGLVFVTFMLIFLPFIIIPALIHRQFASFSFVILRLWSFLFSKLCFIFYDIKGKEHIDARKAYIYTCNHTSFLDTPGIFLGTYRQVRPLGKVELGKIPVFGAIIKSVTVMVDRSNPESRKESIKKLSEMLHHGISILIFPEGTMNRSDKPLQPFYDGAFRLAIESQTPILPMVIINAGKLMPPKGFHLQPGTIKVRIAHPVSTEGLSLDDLENLKEKVYRIMKNMIIDHA